MILPVLCAAAAWRKGASDAGRVGVIVVMVTPPVPKEPSSAPALVWRMRAKSVGPAVVEVPAEMIPPPLSTSALSESSRKGCTGVTTRPEMPNVVSGSPGAAIETDSAQTGRSRRPPRMKVKHGASMT